MNSYDKLNLLFDVSQLVCKEFLSHKKWSCEGDLDIFKVSETLETFAKWVLMRPEIFIQIKNQKPDSNQIIDNLSQIILRLVKCQH